MHVNFGFFYPHPAPTDIYTLSLHDALPICSRGGPAARPRASKSSAAPASRPRPSSTPRALPSSTIRRRARRRSEEHTSELQSHSDLVCRLLLEKKKTKVTCTAYAANKLCLI